jgi:hypothetical protein
MGRRPGRLDKPRHDSASHGADAFRYLALQWREVRPDPIRPEMPAEIAKRLTKPRTFAEMIRDYEAEVELEFDE